MGTTRILGRRDDGPPVYTYEAVPGIPPVSTMRLGRGSSEVQPGAHSHDFLVLAYFERGGGSMWLGNREWQIEAGDVYLIAPGEVVGAGDDVLAASMSLGAGPSSSSPRSSDRRFLAPRRPPISPRGG